MTYESENPYVICNLGGLEFYNYGPTFYDALPTKKEAQQTADRLNNEKKQRAPKMIENHIKYGYGDHDPYYWLKQAKKEASSDYQVISWDDFKKVERDCLLSKGLESSNKEEFWDMLEALPPTYWKTIRGVEMFIMSELLTSNYGQQFGHDKASNKYYKKVVDVKDQSTWIYNDLK